MTDFSGTSGNDTFTGGLVENTASGGAGNDQLTGGGYGDVLAGGSGADTLDGGAGVDWLYSGDASPGFQFPYYGNAYVLPQLDTGVEVDSLQGGDFGDMLFAGYGDNVDGGAGEDALFISFQGAPAGVAFEAGPGIHVVGGGVIKNIEITRYIQGSQFGDNLSHQNATGSGLFISGMDGDDTLTAGYYSSGLFGDSGNDLVDGRQSQYLQFVDGGDGNDTLYGTYLTGAQAVGGAGDDLIYAAQAYGGAGNDVIDMQRPNFAGWASGDEGDDRITGANVGNRIAGGIGADVLTGGDGEDFLFSANFSGVYNDPADDMGLEHDQISAGGGNDVLAIGFGDDADGGGGTDTLRLSFGGLGYGVTFNTAGIAAGSPYTIGGGVIQNVESLVYLRGTDFADNLNLATQSVMLTVNAGGGDDVITSNSSSASVMGGDGDDRLVSGPAGDYFNGGAGRDTIDYSGVGSAISVSLRTGVGVGGDSLISVEGIIGASFNDTLTGTATGSSLSGGAGNDRFEIGAQDSASLGTGADLVYVTAGTHSASAQANVVTVTGWSADDQLQFGAATGAYTETTATTYAGAVQAAEAQAAAGYNFVSVQVGSDVYVFGQPTSGRLHFDDAVRLVGTDLNAVSAANVGLPGPLETPLPPPAPPTTPPPPTTPTTPTSPSSGDPALPAAPSAGVGGASGTIAGDMDHMHLTYVLDAIITDGSNSFVTASLGDISLRLTGFNFALDNNGQLAGGIATSMSYSYGAAHGGPFSLSLATPQVALTTLAAWSLTDATSTFFNTVLAGGDRVGGGVGADLLRGYGGNDLLYGNGGSDTLWGGTGNDVLYAGGSSGGATGPLGSTYLRGEEGNDYILGGAGFDDINGNQGDDVLSGGQGDDWVVGGKDNDLLFGDAGGDVVYGNLGNDTQFGGDGFDWVRGGQGDDSLNGGAGDDWIWGDRGDDTVAGGAGADTFHIFTGGGLDRVTDFNAAEGDRVVIDYGTYAVSQVGSDTVIDLGGGDRMVLVGVTASALPTGWLTAL
ncbi:hypothetical protein [Phenylobacterium sp.]|uniref:hypothetical protein n=1 Tax=Phenylobacterium sp. TaxID=1871053 RepID=UPI003BAD7EEC